MKLIRLLVEESWDAVLFPAPSSGSICFASCLPSSTPHWSYELIFQIIPYRNILEKFSKIEKLPGRKFCARKQRPVRREWRGSFFQRQTSLRVCYREILCVVGFARDPGGRPTRHGPRQQFCPSLGPLFELENWQVEFGDGHRHQRDHCVTLLGPGSRMVSAEFPKQRTFSWPGATTDIPDE